jgi:lactoylglutathione lyase
MQLVKPAIDIALATERVKPLSLFWRDVPGVTPGQVIPMGPGHEQHRFDANGSLLKFNHHFPAPLPDNPPSGYREVLIAGKGVKTYRRMIDPDGNRLSLVPPGFDGVTQLGIRVAVRDMAAHRQFYSSVLELPEEGSGKFRAGETLIFLEESLDAPADASARGRGWRYMTLQISDLATEHAAVVGRGAREAFAPTTGANGAQFSMIRDPDGNWIELLQPARMENAAS